jgi:glycosyltransferase involved in cell wall biosynthesis
MKKKILIIHHHKKFGGASKSLSEYLKNLKKKFEFDIICPYGSTYNFFKKEKFSLKGLPGISCINITEIGLYKSFRLILLLREIYYFIFTFYTFFRLRNNNYDLIYLNDSSLIILAPLIKKIYKVNIICHIRTRVEKKKHLFYNYIKNISEKYISCFVCIDQSTYSTSLIKEKSYIVYNIFSGKKITKKKTHDNFNVGFIGALDFHKGLDFFFRCIKAINKKKKNINFLIAGKLTIGNSFLTYFLSLFAIKKDFNKEMHDFRQNNYNCHFLGSVDKLEEFYNKIDLIVFPSRMNALGRPIIEASYYEIPSIVCLKNVFNDTLQNNKTGFVTKFGDKKLFVNYILKLYKNKKLLNYLGKNAKKNYMRVHNKKKNLIKMEKILAKY